MNILASACGKVILFGEHAVVYNSPAIAVPVLSLKADVSIVEDKSLFLDAKNISVEQDLTKEPVGKDAQAFSVQETIFNALKFFKVPKRQKIRIMIDSQIPPRADLGAELQFLLHLSELLQNIMIECFPKRTCTILFLRQTNYSMETQVELTKQLY